MTRKASESLPLSREGIAAYERGDLALAEERLAEARELNDADVETCRYYGETLWKRGKRAEALDVLRDAADKYGPVEAQVSIYSSLGEKALEFGRPEQTIAWANKTIDLSPKSGVGWRLRGKAYRALDRPKDALDDFLRAARFDVDDREILREIALAQNELGDYDSALASWQYLEGLYPTNREPAEVFAGKGSAYAGLGLLVDAQEAYEVAVRSAPSDPDLRVRLAEVALARGDYARAAALASEALALAPENPAALALYRATRDPAQIAENPNVDKRFR